tara:strand:- start:1776 stop:1973 length:198 start_codon:yes stop_codon:yes gene_type:complete
MNALGLDLGGKMRNIEFIKNSPKPQSFWLINARRINGPSGVFCLYAIYHEESTPDGKLAPYSRIL